MERLTIRSNLDSFTLVDVIDFVNRQMICGTKRFGRNVPLFCVIESMAQLGAIHFRSLLSFQRHVFFMKARRLSFHVKNIQEGIYHLESNTEGHSEKACAYRINVWKENILVAKGAFLFSSISYDSKFRMEKLKNYYEQIFTCLQKNSTNA